MQLFLARGVVEKYVYDHITNGEGRESIDDVRLVYAIDVDDAKVKYYRFWNGKSVDYDVTYYVAKIEIVETLY